LLTALENKIEIKNCQLDLAKKIKRSASSSGKLWMGIPGGSFWAKAYWCDKERFWWAYAPPHRPSYRHWNAFGTLEKDKKPQWGQKKHSLNITAEINIPEKGNRWSVAGIFAKDDNGIIYIGHNGRIFSKKGIGKNAFLVNYSARDSWYQIYGSAGSKSVAIISSMDDKNIVSNIGFFVHEVSRIKNLNSREILQTKKIIKTFKPEFSGIKQYSVNQKIRSESRHGQLINQLKKRVESEGFTSVNYPVDLHILGKNGKSVFIEAKTMDDTTSRYGSIGQLFYYSLQYNQGKKTRLVAMFPNPINSEFKRILAKLGIFCVGYKWKNNRAEFDSMLKNHLNYLK
jgi:hypothetical protein